MKKRALLAGCGSSREKRLLIGGEGPSWEDYDLTTLDVVGTHHPDVEWDLNRRPLPFKDNSFERIDMYEVLEHIGHQGDWKGFFEEFSEYQRILTHGGVLCATVPMWDSPGAWGDPSHTRVITPMTLTFLSQEAYKRDIGKTVMSDFRGVWKGDMPCVWFFEDKEHGNFSFILQVRK